jgi:uncharacterized membrane protein YczE
MKKQLLSLLKLFIGLFLYAVGIVFTINGDLGLAPWDVFHQGLSAPLGLTMGQASILIGLVVVLLDWLLGEKPGLGTLCNMVFIGIFIDLLMLNNLIPHYPHFLQKVMMILIGMLIIGIASYFYLSAGLGSGPRDGLMVSLTKRINKSVRFIRNCIELTVVTLGYLLGGSVGLGTLVMAFAGGYFVQLAFKIFKFDVKGIKHQSLADYVSNLCSAFGQRNQSKSE